MRLESVSADRHVGRASLNGVDDPAVLQLGDRSLIAIGVTYPEGHAPLDVRVWRRSSTGALYWVDARPVSNVPAQALTPK